MNLFSCLRLHYESTILKRIRRESTIIFVNSLSVHYLRRKLTLSSIFLFSSLSNQLFFTEFYYEAIIIESLSGIHYEFTIFFRINFIRREFTKNQKFFPESTIKSTFLSQHNEGCSNFGRSTACVDKTRSWKVLT